MLCCVEEVQEELAAIDLFKGKNTSYELFLERLKSVHSLLLYQKNNGIIWPPRITTTTSYWVGKQGNLVLRQSQLLYYLFATMNTFGHTFRSTELYLDMSILVYNWLVKCMIHEIITPRHLKISICNIWCTGRNNKGSWKSCVSKKKVLYM